MADPVTAAPRWSRGARGVLSGLLALVLVLGLLGGAGALFGERLLVAAGVSTAHTSDGQVPDGLAPTASPSPVGPGPALSGPPQLLAPAGAGRAVTAAGLSEQLAEVARTGIDGGIEISVVDVVTGEPVLAQGASPSMPASTQKLLTGAGVLQLLGPDHTFATTVERRDGRLVLVGGGDPLLSSSGRGYPAGGSLAELAAATATVLTEEAAAAGQPEVAPLRLGLDDSLFTGPGWSPDWPTGYRSQVTPVSALVVDQGRRQGVSPGPREEQPAATALTTFAELLQEQGLAVADVETDGERGAASGVVEPVAVVASAPVGVLVERMLLSSDNDIAEILLRQAGLAAGEEASFDGGGRALVRVMGELGVPVAGMTPRDGSGLSRQNELSATTLTALLRLSATEDGERLRHLDTGLPLAGATGSLGRRFVEAGTSPGRGTARGKTGTLRGTHSLAGYTRTADGRLLTYAFLVNDSADAAAARVWLDRAASALSACGC